VRPNSVGPLFTTPTLRPKFTQEGEMIEFLAQMPTDTMVLAMAFLSLAAMLIVLRRLI
jgi:glucokinase